VSTEEEFLAAIRANPEDAEARSVYADFLDERGDPRGEYLRLEQQAHVLPARLAELAATLDRPWVEKVSRGYELVLLDAGTQKIMCIKIVREITGLGLKDSKDIIDAASSSTISGYERTAEPKVIRSQLSLFDANALLAKFEGIGSKLEIRPMRSPHEPLYASALRMLRRIHVDDITAAGKVDRKRAAELAAELARLAVEIIGY
jgi:uncharacterized protein (TIGR02996 family)